MQCLPVRLAVASDGYTGMDTKKQLFPCGHFSSGLARKWQIRDQDRTTSNNRGGMCVIEPPRELSPS
jgi:hypothetical protein